MGDTLRKAGKRLVVFLLLLCLFLQPGFFPVAAADFSIRLTVPVRVEFELSTDFVDLGPPRTQNNILYYEQKNAVRLSFRTNLASGWEIHVTGSDFSAGDDRSFPVSRLQWRTQQTSYRPMPPAGEYAVVARGENTGGRQGQGQINISYYLELQGDEYEGPYTALITYTFFVP